MNKLGMYLVTFLLATIGPLPTVAAEDATTAIENLLNGYQERLANNDIDGILDLYSANPVFIPEYAPTLGRARLGAQSLRVGLRDPEVARAIRLP
jgi:hypothetical protein